MNLMNIYQRRRREVQFHGFVWRSINLQVFTEISRYFLISLQIFGAWRLIVVFFICILIRPLGRLAEWFCAGLEIWRSRVQVPL